MESFWARALFLMDRYDISQVQLGHYVEKPKTTVSSWIRRDVIPPGDIVYKISILLKTTVEYLVTGVHPEDKQVSDIRRIFQQFIDEQSDEDLQQLWGFITTIRGR